MRRDTAWKIYNKKSSLSLLPSPSLHLSTSLSACPSIPNYSSTSLFSLSRSLSLSLSRSLSLSLSTHARIHRHTHKRGGVGGILLGETRIADNGGDGIERHVGHELSEHLVRREGQGGGGRDREMEERGEGVGGKGEHRKNVWERGQTDTTSNTHTLTHPHLHPHLHPHPHPNPHPHPHSHPHPHPHPHTVARTHARTHTQPPAHIHLGGGVCGMLSVCQSVFVGEGGKRMGGWGGQHEKIYWKGNQNMGKGRWKKYIRKGALSPYKKRGSLKKRMKI
jgi:hypothetical protein